MIDSNETTPIMINTVPKNLFLNSYNAEAVQRVLKCVKIGDQPIPCVDPNVRPDSEIQDIEHLIGNIKRGGFSCCDITTIALSGLSILGSCYASRSSILINSDWYGFIIDSGRVVFLRPGWHFVGYLFMTGLVRHYISSEFIKVNNVQIIRIRQDEIGIGIDNTNMEILLPGTHTRVNGSYVFLRRHKLNSDITEGPFKIVTVKTGTVGVSYDNGVAKILSEGQYAVNSNGLQIGYNLDITQQNLKFSKHKVLLEGGINILVEGLLTYQVIDVAKLIRNVDVDQLRVSMVKNLLYWVRRVRS